MGNMKNISVLCYRNSKNTLLVEEQFCSYLPNTFFLSVILFLGACTTPPRLSVVTEFMEMGSLYHLIHVSGQKNNLSWQRRLKMICDICRYFQHKLCTQIPIHSSSFPTKFFITTTFSIILFWGVCKILA